MWAFEQNEKIEEKIRTQIEYQLRLRIESRLALEKQLIDRQQRREQEERNEKAFCEKQLQMLAERDKVEQLSNEKRRRKLAEHRKAIQEMLEERRCQRAVALAEEIKLRDIEKQQEKRKYVFKSNLFTIKLIHYTSHLISFADKKLLKRNASKYFKSTLKH